MCGIFGLVRNSQAAHPERATAVFVELGHHSIERGRDSAGFAWTHPADPRDGDATDSTNTPLPDDFRGCKQSKHLTMETIDLIKDTVSFDRLWDDATHLPLIATAPMVMGHTRWATQGAKDSLSNASPLTVGHIVGTHNGDVDKATIKRTRPTFGASVLGSTDTERLYAEVSDLRSHRRKITDLLSTVKGRAALAWYDRNRPERLYLARAALSPLAIAWDAEGNLYWASNPRWFRDIDTKFGGSIGFRDIAIIREGVLLTVRIDGPEPLIEDMRTFKPVCRASDDRLSDMVVWRGFTAEDREADKAQANHRVAAAPMRVASSGKTGKRSTSTASVDWSTVSDRYRAAYPSAEASRSVAREGFGAQAHLWDEETWDQSRWDDTLALTSGHHDSDDSQGQAEDLADLVVQVAEQWLDNDEDPAAVQMITRASLPSEKAAVCEEWDLPVEAFEMLRESATDYLDLIEDMAEDEVVASVVSEYLHRH